MKYETIKTFLILMLIGIAGVLIVRNAKTASANEYISIQDRRLPCGRTLRKIVEERDGGWRKTMQLLDASGAVLKSKSKTIETEVCRKIKDGIFVTGLWSDCSIEI